MGKDVKNVGGAVESGDAKRASISRMVSVSASWSNKTVRRWFSPWDVVIVNQGDLVTNGTIVLSHGGQTHTLNFVGEDVAAVVERIEEAKARTMVELFAGQVVNSDWESMLGVVARTMAKEMGADSWREAMAKALEKIVPQAVEDELARLSADAESSKRKK